MKVRGFKWAFTAICAMLFVTTTGCETSHPFSETGKSKTMRKASEINFVTAKTPGLNKLFQSTETITAASGGTVEVGDVTHGISDITFGPGDVSTDVAVTFIWESTGLMQGATFLPHGLQFNNPIKMELSYKDADLTGVVEDSLKIWYHHETTDEWEMIGNDVNKLTKTVTGWTTHFSRYAIGSE